MKKINNDITTEEGLNDYLKVAKNNTAYDNLNAIKDAIYYCHLGTSSEEEVEKFNSLIESLIKLADKAYLRSTVAINEINNIYKNRLLMIKILNYIV